MSLYLIDFENVHDSGLSGVTYLTENDEVCIFYSIKSEHMSFDTHVNIMKTAARVKYVKLRRSAKNYLDFQLATHLGYLIGAEVPGPYFVISKDTGYDSVIDYWKDHGVMVTRQPSIGYNRSQARATGQTPTPQTPPAVVTIQENSHVVVASTTAAVINAAEGRANAGTQTDTPAALLQTALQEGSETPAENNPEQETSGKSNASRSRSRKGNKSRNADQGKKQDLNHAEEESEVIQEPVTAEPEAEAAQDLSLPAEAETQSASKKEKSAGKSKKNLKTAKKEPSEPTEPETAKTEVISAAAPSGQDVPAISETSQQAGNSAEETTEVLSSASQTETVVMIPDSLPESYRKRVRSALKGKGIPSAHYSAIYKAIFNSYDKLALNNLLVKTFGSSKGGAVYNLIRDIFTDYHVANLDR